MHLVREKENKIDEEEADSLKLETGERAKMLVTKFVKILIRNRGNRGTIPVVPSMQEKHW